MDIANLQIKADSKQVKQAIKALDKLGIQAEVTERKNKKLKKSQFELNDVFGKSIFTIKNLIGTYIGFNALRIADQFTLIKARVAQSTDSLQEANKAFKALQRGAIETGSSLEASVEIFQRLSFSRKEIEATTDQMLSFTKAVQQLGVVSGASGVALDAGLKQLGQALSSNVFRAEEFNSLLENVPAIANEIAAGLGVTTGQLRTLVIEGKLASKDVFDVIIASTDIINEKFEQFKKNNPLSFAFSQLSTSFQVYLGQLNQSIGLTSFLADVTRGLAENIETIGNVAIIAAAGITTYILAQNVGAVVAFTKAIFTLNLTMAANPYVAVATALALVVTGFLVYQKEIESALDKTELFGINVGAVFDGIKISAITVFKGLLNTITFPLRAGLEYFKSVVGQIKILGNQIIKFINEKFNGDVGLISISNEEAKAAGKNFAQIVIDEAAKTFDSNIEIFEAGKESYRLERSNVGRAGSKTGSKEFGPTKLDFLIAQQAKSLEGLREKYAEILGGIGGDTSNLTGKTNDLKNKQDEANEKFKESQSALQKYGEEARNVTAQLQDMGVRGLKSLEDNLVGLIRGTVSVADAFKSMADQIIDDLIRIQVKQQITEPISGAFNSLIPSIGSALFGGGGSSLSAGATGLASQGSLFKFNTGGSFTVGGSGGPDSQLVPLQLTPGEIVNVKKGGQQEQRAPNIIINNNAPQAQVSAGVGPNGFDINVVIDDAFASNASRRGTKTFNTLNNLGTPLSRG